MTIFAQAWKSNLATAILHWWTLKVKSTTAVVDQNAKTALVIVIAIRQRDLLVAAKKVSEKNFQSDICLISNVFRQIFFMHTNVLYASEYIILTFITFIKITFIYYD